MLSRNRSLVIFGAGRIGRSFIGYLFTSNGWDVTFVDVNWVLVDALNARGSYPLEIKRRDLGDKRVVVRGVQAIHASEEKKINEALLTCTLCATAVGMKALNVVAGQIILAVRERLKQKLPPLNIIIAENIRNGADVFRKVFVNHGLKGDEAGFVETSIGKMVPLMSKEELADDPLLLHAEEYNTLILDARGFQHPEPNSQDIPDIPDIPEIMNIQDIPEIKAVNNIKAWVDRKLFIHNLGHAAVAYCGFIKNPDCRLIADVLDDSEIRNITEQAMLESAAALYAEYPGEFTSGELEDHISDLLYRFGNRALGDTVFRVGRDLQRKLGRNERLCGSVSLCLKHGLPCDSIVQVFRAALAFRATDDKGEMFSGDISLIKEFTGRYPGSVTTDFFLENLDFKRSDRNLILLLANNHL